MSESPRRSGRSLWVWGQTVDAARAGKRCAYIGTRRDSWERLATRAVELEPDAFSLESAGDVLRHASGGCVLFIIPSPDPMEPRETQIIVDDVDAIGVDDDFGG